MLTRADISMAVSTQDDLTSWIETTLQKAHEEGFGEGVSAPRDQAAPATMSRSEALDKAQELVGKLATIPLNSRGYPADGHKAASLDERTAAILSMARFLMGGE